MPAKLKAYTGMDALTHAVEAYTSTVRNDFTNPLAMKAIEMVKENLIDFNKKTAVKTYADIARRLGLAGNSEDELTN